MTAATLQENKMGVMPVGKLIANMALPMVISMLVQALYNVVDSIYVSQVSESAVTALSLAFPIQNLLIGFAVGIGVGVNSLLSKSLGEKNQEAANRAAGNGIVLMAIAMVLFVLFGLFGVYFKLQSFFFMPLFGLNNATISIIAYNYGARKPQRITKTLKISCTAALCLMTVGLLVFQFFPDLLLGLFNPSQAFLEIGRVALRTISWSFPIAAICIALGASFQALGNGIYSTIVSLCRQLVVLLPVAYLLSLTGEVQRVWLAFPIAEIVSGTVTFICFTRIYRQKIKPLFEQA